MNKNIIIPNIEEFERKKKIFIDEGSEKIHVVSDFDRTLTKGLTGEGKRTAIVIFQLRSDSKYLGEEYSKKAYELFDIYHPIEMDNSISLDEKKKKMYEWWRRHFDLIASVGLTKSLIEKVVKEKPLQFRNGSSDFVKILYAKDIPLVIMSAAPGNMLIEYLKKEELMLSNVSVISNRYKFDRSGNAVEIIEPIIHTFNKTEISLHDFSLFKKIEKRKNVILLGDSLGDVGMVEGFDYDNLIKIGFYNQGEDEGLDDYRKNFDVVILNDGDMSFVNKSLKEILG
jgi:cytosolic 5'-nucleotidase 3